MSMMNIIITIRNALRRVYAYLIPVLIFSNGLASGSAKCGFRDDAVHAHGAGQSGLRPTYVH